MITPAEAAKTLGVSVARVHQLVDEGALPPPERHGARTLLWPVSYLELYRSTNPHSGVLAHLDRPTHPPVMTTNRTLQLDHRVTPVHIRVWTSPELPATVVIGDLTDGPPALNSRDLLAIAHALDLDPLAPTWLCHRVRDDNVPELHNLVMEQCIATRYDRALARLRGDVPPAAEMRLAHQIPIEIKSLSRLLRAPLETMVDGTYTSTVVDAWITHRRDSLDDLEVEEPAAARWLHSHGDQALHLAALAHQAPPAELKAVLETAVEVLIARLRFIAARLPDPPARPRAHPGTVWVTRLVRPELSVEEEALLMRYPPALPFEERQPIHMDPYLTAARDMQTWSTRCADKRDDLAAAALERAAAIINGRWLPKAGG